MKLSKKMKIALGAAICSGLLGLGTAHAGTECLDATIVKTGVYPYLPATVKYAVYAECNDTDPEKWTGTKMFFVSVLDDYADAFYAAGLTAVATGNTATLLVSSPDNYGDVKMLSVKSAP